MAPDRKSVAATPAGVVGSCAVYRGCRCAQPPAHGWHPCGMAASEPGGFRAISRWSRRTAPTPPEHDPPKPVCIPEGCHLWPMASPCPTRFTGAVHEIPHFEGFFSPLLSAAHPHAHHRWALTSLRSQSPAAGPPARGVPTQNRVLAPPALPRHVVWPTTRKSKGLPAA
jgi:hypothetical protein